MSAPVPLAQNADVRYLGRLLGDVIRALGGQRLYERIEAIRATSVKVHRGLADEALLGQCLEALDADEQLGFVRGFMLFSMLANLAEDRQGGATGEGTSLAEAIDALAAAGIDARAVADLLDSALVMPVLTAHPTEVMRKSMLDHRARIAQLMALRDAGATTTADGDDIEQALVRQIALMWQTRPLRRERMQVQDEVEIALAWLRDVLLQVLPRLYAGWDRLLPRRAGTFLKLGTWIGGDRDGNPNVDASTLRYALRTAARTLLGEYMAQVHALGKELSISTELAEVSEEVLALAAASGDPHPGRRDEPVRRALSGIHARLAATYTSLTGQAPPRPPVRELPPYASPQELRRDLVAIARSLATHGGSLLASSGALGRLVRLVEACGFHLATIDLRQNSDVHERVVAELLRVAGVEADYGSLEEGQRVQLLRRELASPRLLYSPFAQYGAECLSELDVVREAAASHRLLGPDCISQYIISRTQGVSDLLEACLLLKEAGL